jgi:hypothetical protein
MGDSLRDFARKMRESADKVDPSIRMGFCSGYTSWDLEGADAIELTKIFAGDNKPFLRYTGAPYWVPQVRFKGQSLQTIVERIVQEINRAYESENFIYNELLKEKSFAEDCDAALQAAIESEEKRATSEENSIKKSLELLQNFAKYKNILQLNSLIQHGYSAIGSGEEINANEVISGYYDIDGQFKDDASILTSIYELPLGKAYSVNCPKLQVGTQANIVLFDDDGNVYPFSINLNGAIFIPDRLVSRIGLSYIGVVPVVKSFNLEQVVATVADGTVSRKKLSDELLEELDEILRSVANEVSRAMNAETRLMNELQNESSSNAEAFENMQSQLENEIIRSTVVDKNLLKRVEKLESSCVVLSEDEYDSIEYKDEDTLYFITES